MEDGKSTVTVAIDNKAVVSKIDDAIKNNTTGTGNVIQVPVTDTKSEVAKVELTGDIVKKKDKTDLVNMLIGFTEELHEKMKNDKKSNKQQLPN